MALLQSFPTDESSFLLYLLLAFVISCFVLYGIISSATRSKRIETLLARQLEIMTAFANKYDITFSEIVDTNKINLIGKTLDEISELLGKPDSKSVFDSESMQYTWENHGAPVTFIFNKHNISLKQL